MLGTDCFRGLQWTHFRAYLNVPSRLVVPLEKHISDRAKHQISETEVGKKKTIIIKKKDNLEII